MRCFARMIGWLAALAALFAPAAVAALPAVTDVRIGEDASGTRVVLQLSQPVEYRFFTLPAPDRFVIDLPEMDWRTAADSTEGRGLVARLRVGLFKPGTSRVVFDLREPARVRQAFLMEAADGIGPRLVVDLEPLSPVRTASAATSAGPPLSVPARIFEQTALVVPPAAAPLPSPPPARRRDKPVIALDAGHGGVDPGAIGVSGQYEKHVTLSMAKELKRALEETGRYEVFLTRDRDVFIRLHERIALARKAGAELFISLHADSSPNGREARGLSVYTLSEKASDREAAALAAKENKADLIAGVNLASEAPEVVGILIDLAQRETMNLSAHYASMLVRDLGREAALLQNTHRFAGFAVLKAPDVPSVLVELGYLSNPEEERLLRSKRYRAGLADAIVRATDRYFAHRSALLRS